MDRKDIDEGAMSGKIRTNFFDKQAAELSTPASKRGPIQVVLIIIGLAVAYGLYQLAMYFINYEELSAMKNIEVSFQKPMQKEGSAVVSAQVDNYNPFQVKDIAIKYTILNKTGKEIAQGKIVIPNSVPAGDSRSFANIKLENVGEDAGRMQAELIDVQLGKKPDISAEAQARFVEAAAMQDKEALQYFKDFIASNANFAPAYVELGLSYAANGEFDNAMASYKKAIQIDPSDANAYFNLGIANYYKRNFTEARTAFEQAQKLAPDDPAITDAIKQLGNNK
jgi:tetratricopeptide (TPR) repeat protein